MGRIASIEIGSNSIRMLIAEEGRSDSPLKPILRKRVITRLGEDFNRRERGTIKPGPMERSIAVLRDFFGIASRFGVSSPIVMATGVVRKALNGDSFIASIAERFGHNAKVISGQEEAELTCKGVLSWLSHRGGPFVVFDLGGGSTEFIWSNNGRQSISIELGVVGLTEDYLITDPPKDDEIHRLSNHIEDTFRGKLDPLKERVKEGFSMVGTGGSVVTSAKIIHGLAEDECSDAKINGLVLRGKDLKPLFDKMKGMPREKRLNLKGLEMGREDIILAGTLMVIEIMDYFDKDEAIVSYSDLLEGSLIHYMEGERDG